MAKWTIKDGPDLTGLVAIVTGGNSGLGRQSCCDLAGMGATVVSAVRSQKKGDHAANSIQKFNPAAEINVMQLDLADLSSIRAFAEKFKSTYDRLDILLNNAGVMALPRRETRDGFEMQFGINHLGHFALTGHLIDCLLATSNSRVVNVSSGLHRKGAIDFDDVMGKNNYEKWAAYAQSKLANLLFSRQMQRKLEESGSSTISVGTHPGMVDTNLARRGPEMEKGAWMGWIVRTYIKFAARNVIDGVLPQLYASVMPGVVGGSFFGPKEEEPGRLTPEIQDPGPAALDNSAAARLWELSEELTGVRFPI